MTREQAVQHALDWAEGRLSHLNEMMGAENGVENRTLTLAHCAQADAAEVVKWSALAQALPSEAS